MLSKFFIERPIFANVIAVVTIIMGLVAVFKLPVEQYPNITPPTVQVSTVYPGADPKVVADAVASPIEQQVNGVEGMLYMSSTSASDGSYVLTVTFDVGTNPDLAQVLVQNRVAIALPQLPQEVQRQGLITKKQSTAIVQFVTLSSPDQRYDDLFLGNYATIRIVDELSRIKGVGDVKMVPAKDYSMRVWLDPDKLRSRHLTTQDVTKAIQEQNVQVAAGQIGQQPVANGANFQYTITALGRLQDVEQFENIVIKTGQDGTANAGRVTKIKDVARVELGGKSYDQAFQYMGKPAAGIAIFQLPGSNALELANAVRAKMAELSKSFPQGMEYAIPFDTTRFIAQSIDEVYSTLFEAGLLVLLVIMVFLQDWRAVLIPATTVPVTIIGAFGAMALLGFTINMQTLFGLVLAIGIVVDDAIVIVEAAVFNMDHHGMNPKDATIKAMSELLGPIIGITLVLMAVFIPAAFLSGVTGQLYRQFALTIAATALISAINALTLKPAQAATYLRPTPAKRNAFFRGFNTVFAFFESLYARMLSWIVRHKALTSAVFASLVLATAWLYTKQPAGFLPVEDQGYLVISAVLPDAASLERTNEVVSKVNTILKRTPGVDGWVSISGNSIFDNAALPNAATFYVPLKDWSERKSAAESQDGILAGLRGEFSKIQEASVIVFPPPAIRGLGTAGGFQLQIQDRDGAGLNELAHATQALVQESNKQASLASTTTTFHAEVPQLYADVDRVKAKVMDIPLDNVFGTLQTYLGSTYVNDFNKFGRTYQVRVQADQKFRADAESIKRLEVRNNKGQMAPLGTVVNVAENSGPQIINRYNLYPSAAINGQSAFGVSSDEALKKVEALADSQLPSSMGYEWTGMSYQEKKAGGEAFYVYLFAVVLVYLVLAAQYESLTSPAAVIFVVPLALLGAVVAVATRGMDINVYTQIGILLIIALASKNAILIVEVARELRAEGHSIIDAAIEAGRRRFRPILMTSFAFILGVVPLVFAKGAGAAGRQALGTAVFGGMLASTVLAVGFVPVFYVLWQNVSEYLSKPKPATQAARSSIAPAIPH